MIEDFYSIGEDMREDSDGIRHDRYMELMRTPQHQSKKLAEGEYGSTKRLLFESADNDHKYGEVHEGANDSTPYDPKNESPRKDDVEEQDQDLVSSQLLSPSISLISPMKPEKRDGTFEEIDPNLAPRFSNFSKPEGENVETKNKTYEKPSPSRLSHSTNLNRSTVENHRELSNDKTQKDRKPIIPMKRRALSPDSGSMTSVGNKELNNRFTPTKKVDNQITSPFRRSPRFPADSSLGKRKNLLPIKRPLNIRSLDSITGQHAARNKVYDFFAVVYSVEPSVVKPAVMPLKRDMRITDPSTEKKVLVSVFVDPVSFKPAVGTIALFRSLTTHEWDRGMLNAYPQHCEGRDWFIVDPSGIEGCDVKHLREWWKKKSVELTESSQQHPS